MADGGHLEKWSNRKKLSHALPDFDEIWRIGALWCVVKTGSGSRNEPSAAAILNIVFREYIGCRAADRIMHQTNPTLSDFAEICMQYKWDH